MRKVTIYLVFMGFIIVACSAPYTQSYTVPDFQMQKYKKVAVLPIVNLTTNTFADLQVPDLLFDELAKRKFDVLRPANVKEILLSKNLQDSISESTSFNDVARWLEVDGIFTSVVGAYGYDKVEHAGFSIPYTTYQKESTRGFVGGEYVSLETNVPKTNYIDVPDRTYNYATAEIMISLYDGNSGELVFTVLDFYSSSGYKLQEIASYLIRSELAEVLGYEKIKR